MLEIPESLTIVRQVNETICGKKIVAVRANSSPHGFAFYFGDPSAYASLLCGRDVENAVAVAGQVEIHAGETRILLGDGVNIRYVQAVEKLPAKHQLHVEFEDGSSMVCSIQMYGGIWVFLDGENNDNFYYTVAKEKPHPLSEEFDRNYFEKLFQSVKPKLSAKAFLATEQRIPGLGNGVLQDILFCSGIHPKTKLENLTSGEMDSLFDKVKSVLAKMTEAGGRNTEKDLFGQVGGYETFLSAKTLKFPCPVCGGTIQRQAYLGGNVYFCPDCQPL